MAERLPEPDFLKLCIRRDLTMASECLVEAGDLDRRTMRWARLESKLRRRADRGLLRIKRGRKIRVADPDYGSIFRRVPWEEAWPDQGAALVEKWCTRAADRRIEANIVGRHTRMSAERAAQLRAQAKRLQRNAVRCGHRLAHLIGA